ncbi:MAG: lipoate--protein ligase family protein [Chlamydiales bacterium]|nr:lipoate--protein ligase family protein [Chlamydiia bacterium]MCP5507479.1 lipoate--protein ligase family protein [Chlamydiales bacterium]
MPQSIIHLLQLHQVPIFRQLQIEEALLRCDNRNWCILNEGSTPAIVMGISAKEAQWVNLPLLQKKPLPLIRRFSGGGTVVVDESTLFATLIGEVEDSGVSCSPDHVHSLALQIYQDLFVDDRFSLRENDYVFGEKKFGGNAQYLRKGRWLHHTSFLWQFDPQKMEYLTLPPKMPSYRKKRPHHEFLCTLDQWLPSREMFRKKMIDVLKKRYHVREVGLEEIEPFLSIPHRKATKLISV